MQWLSDLFKASLSIAVFYFTGAEILLTMKFFRIVSSKLTITNLDVGLACAMLAVICLHIRRERQVNVLEERLRQMESKNGNIGRVCKKQA